MRKDYLPLVVEEIGEVLQAIGKIERFGPYNHWDREGKTNLKALANEIGQLFECVDRLDLPLHEIAEGRRQKIENLKIYGPGGKP